MDASDFEDATSSYDKKKHSKLIKRAVRGDVNTFPVFQACALGQVAAKPEIFIVADKSRETAPHDLNLSEVRDLLLSLFSDQLPPKWYQFRNKACVRTVVVVHVADALPRCLDGLLRRPSATADAERPGIRASVVRISKQDSELCSMAERLLTVADDDAAALALKMGMASIGDQPLPVASSKSNAASSGGGGGGGGGGGSSSSSSSSGGAEGGVSVSLEVKLGRYVLSHGIMNTWGFPLPLPRTATASSSSSAGGGLDELEDGEEASCDSGGARKRARLDAIAPAPAPAPALAKAVPAHVDPDGVAAAADTGPPIGVIGGEVSYLPSQRFAAALFPPLTPDGVLSGDDGRGAGQGLERFTARLRDGVTKAGFVETVARGSATYNRLWGDQPPPPATTTTTAAAAADAGAVPGGCGPLAVVAVDCEMCDTASGMELTRLTLVDDKCR